MKRSFLILALLAAVASAQVQTIRQNPGFNAQSVPRNDDGSSGLVGLGFSVNYFGKNRSACYVNNNGNITFDSPLATFTPFGLVRTAREIIAPFFADVDTRNTASKLVYYGLDAVDGKRAFGVNYIDVGYFNEKAEKLNKFQVVLIDRSDTGIGNFDIEFNYERIQWETGDASGGTGGYGGTPAAVGWSNGTGEEGTFFEWPGSLISGQFLDGGPRALIRQRFNSNLPGRLVFRARDGQITPALDITTNGPLAPGTVGALYSYQLKFVGGTAPARWSWSPDIELPPGLTLSESGEIRGVPTQGGTWNMTLSLTARTEDGDRTITRRASITVRPPTIQVSTACPLPLATANRPYSQFFRATGLPVDRYQWNVEDIDLLPPGMTFNPDGQLAGTPLVEGIYNFSVRAASAANDGSQPATRSCRLEVRGAELSLMSASACELNAATIGVPYLQRLTVEGGYAPYRWTLRGQLPVGLSLTSAGEITGLPTVNGEYNFAVDVRDARGQVQTRDCSLSTRSAELAVQGCPLPQGNTAESYDRSLRAVGGIGPYSWSVSGMLPPGLTLAQNGTLSGTPRQAGPFRFRVIAADSEGRQAGENCSVSILAGRLGLAPCLPQAQIGEFYSRTLQVAGGDGPYYFRFSGLPAGLSGSPRGTVDGNPSTAGTFPYSVEVTDAKGNVTTKDCVLTVKAQPMVLSSSCPLPAARLGQAYSAQLEVKGGQGPYRFSYEGLLPPGITTSEEGKISGTPSQIASRDFWVEIQDSLGNNTRQGCSLSAELPRVPQMKLTGVPATVGAAVPTLSPVIELSEAYSQPIEGTLILEQFPETMSGEGLANQPDPKVRFLNGQQLFYFTIPAGSRRITVPIATSGTVAGTVTLRVTDLRAARVTLPGYVEPTTYRVAPAVPSLSSACFTTLPGAIEVTVNGLSNTRELQLAAVKAGTQTYRLKIENEANEYFGNDTSIRNGGAFNVRFVVGTGTVKPTTLDVTISNAVGISETRQATACR